MRKINLEVPEGKTAKWVGGVLTLVDEQPQNVMDRIKTFEDACEALGDDNALVNQYHIISTDGMDETGDDIIAYLKLRIIAAALNEGWEPKFTKDERRWFPWFYLYTQEEIDKMSEEDKHRVVFRSSNHANALGGVAYASALNDSAYSYAHFGSRLAFRTSELAKYAGTQFTEIFADFVFKTNKE